MGDPVHKAALSTLDTFLAHGLFRGAYQGHIGTAFFQDLGWTYTMLASHEDDDTQDDTEPLGPLGTPFEPRPHPNNCRTNSYRYQKA